MSEDEILALIVSALFATCAWAFWFFIALEHKSFAPTPAASRLPWLAAPIAAAVLFGVLKTQASHDVRDSATYLLFYMVMGGAVVAAGLIILDRLGLSLRDDVIERRNPAACLAWTGAVVGLTLAYAGANIGDGPGWWVVIFCSGLSVTSLLLGWLLLGGIGQAGEAIVVERDPAAGARVAGWFIGAGAMLGRGAAGDWTSATAAARDFSGHAAAALGFTLLAVVVESKLNHAPQPGRPWALRGAVVGLVWLGLGLAYVALFPLDDLSNVELAGPR